MAKHSKTVLSSTATAATFERKFRIPAGFNTSWPKALIAACQSFLMCNPNKAARHLREISHLSFHVFSLSSDI